MLSILKPILPFTGGQGRGVFSIQLHELHEVRGAGKAVPQGELHYLSGANHEARDDGSIRGQAAAVVGDEAGPRGQLTVLGNDAGLVLDYHGVWKFLGTVSGQRNKTDVWSGTLFFISNTFYYFTQTHMWHISPRFELNILIKRL